MSNTTQQEIVKYEGKNYLVRKNNFRKIKTGELAYSPFSESIILVDVEDDLKYINDNYYKVKPTIQ